MTELGTANPTSPAATGTPAPAKITLEDVGKDIGSVLNTVSTDAGKFLTPRVRKFLYPIAGAIGAAASALAPVWPGTTGQVLDAVAAACTALVAGVAVSHI